MEGWLCGTWDECRDEYVVLDIKGGMIIWYRRWCRDDYLVHEMNAGMSLWYRWWMQGWLCGTGDEWNAGMIMWYRGLMQGWLCGTWDECRDGYVAHNINGGTNIWSGGNVLVRTIIQNLICIVLMIIPLPSKEWCYYDNTQEGVMFLW